MKHLRRILFISVLTVFMICALTPVLVSADSPRENIYQYESPNGYYVNTLVASDKKRVVGFQFLRLVFRRGYTRQR